MPRIRLHKVRLSFPSLYRPTAMKEGDKPSYKASFLFPPDHPDVPKLKAAITEAATERWKDKAPAMLAALQKQDRLCLHDGTLKATKYDGYEGMLYVSAASQVKPSLRDRDPHAPEPTEASGRLYSGCYVNAILDIYAQDNSYGQRVNAALKGVQFIADGNAFAAGPPATDDDFEEYTEGDGANSDDSFFG